jgi:tellurite methyltransferase
MNAPPTELPAGAVAVRCTSIFDETSMPAGLRANHRTAPGVWGVIHVVNGRLRLRADDPVREVVVDQGGSIVIPPGQTHQVTPLGRVRFFVEFLRAAAGQSAPVAPSGGEPAASDG